MARIKADRETLSGEMEERKMHNRKKEKVSQKEFEQIVKMLNAGLSYDDVAEMMQISSSTVQIYKTEGTWENHEAECRKKLEKYHARQAEKKKLKNVADEHRERDEKPGAANRRTVIGSIMIERTEKQEMITLCFDGFGVLENLLRREK